MKLKFIIVLSLIAVISMAAFQSAKPGNAQKDKIKQIINLKNGIVSEYAYTPTGRISMIKTSKGISSTYEYTDRMVMRRVNDPPAKNATLDSMILNSKGQAAMVYQALMVSSTVVPTQCEYDGDGHLVVSKFEYDGKVISRDAATYKDGNEISLQQKFDAEKPSMEYFSYYTDRRNTINNENMGMDFMGKGSKNPLKEMIVVSSVGDTTRSFFFYHYDTSGRISIKTSYNHSKLMDSLQYSYY